MGSQTEPYGRRLIPTMIDDRALETPNRQFAIIPKSDNLQDGFKSLSYQSYANAINKLSWWLEDRLGRSHETDFETVAYIGPNDLRYAMLCTAAVKTHRQVCDSLLFPCSFCNFEMVVQHLSVDLLDCRP